MQTLTLDQASKAFYQSVRNDLAYLSSSVVGIAQQGDMDFEKSIPSDPKDIYHAWKHVGRLPSDPISLLVTVSDDCFSDEMNRRFSGDISNEMARMFWPRSSCRLFCNHDFWQPASSHKTGLQTLRIMTFEDYAARASLCSGAAKPIYMRGLGSAVDVMRMFLRGERPVSVLESGFLHFHNADRSGMELTIHDWLHVAAQSRFCPEINEACRCFIRAMLDVFDDAEIDQSPVLGGLGEQFCDQFFPPNEFSKRLSDGILVLKGKKGPQCIALIEKFIYYLQKSHVSTGLKEDCFRSLRWHAPQITNARVQG